MTAAQSRPRVEGSSLFQGPRRYHAGKIVRPYGSGRGAEWALLSGRRLTGVHGRIQDGGGLRDSAGLNWTSWDMIQTLCRADQAHSGTTDATRTERGIHTERNGETAGQQLFRWAGMGSLYNRRLRLRWFEPSTCHTNSQVRPGAGVPGCWACSVSGGGSVDRSRLLWARSGLVSGSWRTGAQERPCGAAIHGADLPGRYFRRSLACNRIWAEVSGPAVSR